MFKRPALIPQEQGLEDRKKRIRDLMRNCRSRGKSISILMDLSRTEDVLILLQHFLMDLLILAGMIHNVAAPETLEDAHLFVERLPDKRMAAFFRWVVRLRGARYGRGTKGGSMALQADPIGMGVDWKDLGFAAREKGSLSCPNHG